MRLIYLFIFLLTPWLSGGQTYKLTDTKVTSLKIDRDVNIDKVAYKFNNEDLYVFQTNISDLGFAIIYNKININSGVIDDSAVFITQDPFFIKDVSIVGNTLLLCTDDKYATFNLRNPEKTFSCKQRDTSLRFSNSYCINDSLVLLYQIYDYHPYDGVAGLYMYVLNINTSCIENKKFEEFPSVLLSHMSKTWLTVIKGKVYVISPLTGNLSCYNLNLKKISNTNLKLKELQDNQLLEKALDTTYFNERNRLLAYRNNSLSQTANNPNFVYESKVYSKEYIWENISKVRSSYNFIERIYSINNEMLGLTISRPIYKDAYRDFYTFEPGKETHSKAYRKFLCKADDSIRNASNFFGINLKKSEYHSAFFSNNVIYEVSFYNPNIIPPNDINIDEFYYKEVKRNGYRIYILKYELINTDK